MHGTTTQGFPSYRRHYSLAVVIFVVVGTFSFAVDYSVANWMAGERLRNTLTGDTYSVIRLSESFSHGMIVLLIILLIVRLDNRGWRVFPFLATSSLGAGIAANVCKTLVARTRPSKHVLVGDAFNSFGTWFPTDYSHDLQSFPSAHTAVGVGFAFALTQLYPRGAGFFWLFAMLAALQRVDAGAHYVSDVAVGSAIGIAVAWVATGLSACSQDTKRRGWIFTYEIVAQVAGLLYALWTSGLVTSGISKARLGRKCPGSSRRIREQ